MITEAEAIERAKERLAQMNVALKDRQAVVSLAGEEYKVVFPPPVHTLGGDFTLFVDAQTGVVRRVTIER